MPFAFPNVTGPVFTLTSALLDQGCAAAAASARQRIILPLHRDQGALVQRMLNFMQPTTYIQPHLHPMPYASETIHVLRGAIGFLVFDAEGNITERYHLRADGLGFIDIEPNVWHGFVVLEPDTAIIEIKRGPYDALHDKVFAAWAPAEGDAAAASALSHWVAAFAV